MSWTLIIEFVFYGICLVGHRTLARRWQAIAAVAVLCVLAQWQVDPPTLLAGSSAGGARFILLLAAPFVPVMLIGTALSSRSRGHLSAPTASLLVVGLTAVHVGLLQTSAVLPTTLTYQVTFLIVIVVACAVWRFGGTWRRLPVVGLAADISFPLYVVHAPLGYFLLSVLVGAGCPPSLAVLVALAAAVGAAWVLHTLVETPTHRLGQRLARRRSAGSRTAVDAGPAPTAWIPLGARPPVPRPVEVLS